MSATVSIEANVSNDKEAGRTDINFNFDKIQPDGHVLRSSYVGPGDNDCWDAVKTIAELRIDKGTLEAEVVELKRQLEEANERMAYIQTTWHEQNEHQHATIDRYREKLAEMRGDIVELLYEIGPCERDEPRDYCFAHGQSACGFEELRAKYLEVKP